MRIYIYSKESLVFVLLVLVTLSSWYISSFSKANVISGSMGGVFVLLFAFFKVWLVIRFFMEVRDATLALRRLTDIWVLIASIVVSSIYYFQLH